MLCARIRQRLLQVGRSLRGDEVDQRDRFLQAVLQAYPAGPARSNAAFRLILAGEGIHAAGEAVIDAWCERLLREQACDSLFDETERADPTALVIRIMLKHWRAQVFPMHAVLLEQLLGLWQDTEARRRELARLLPTGVAPLSAESLKELIEDLGHPLHAWLNTPENLQQLRAWQRPRPTPDQPLPGGQPPAADAVEQWFDQLPPAEAFEFPIPASLGRS